MGVTGLWTVVQPCARPTNLATLNRKRLAVDASIWIYQFLKAVRDKEGNALRNSHVVGFFRRICKLLWFGIQPIFVFDGGAPALKRQTISSRKQRREGKRDDAVRTAGKLLAVQMQRLAEEEDGKRRRQRDVEASGAVEVEEPVEEIPEAAKLVYVDELGMSQQERQKTRKFNKQDPYHLPKLEGNIDGMGKPEDPRIMSVSELEEYARQFNSGEDINLYDFSKIDFDGEFFKSLPAADRYNILNAARLRSRLRMGLSKEQLEDMFPDRMAFSRFQIERVAERNRLTQRLMKEAGMTGTDLTVSGGRIAGEKDREYILIKNDGAEGGYALGVVRRDKDLGAIHKPIDVDAIDVHFQSKEEDEWEDDDFEDVPIEGLNRLPKVKAALPRDDTVMEDDEDSLFVHDTALKPVSLSSTRSDDRLQDDEEEDINRAIEMSLRKQFRAKSPQPGEEDEQLDVEPVLAPEWTQKAVEPLRPVTSSHGSVIAHMVNSRANASVPKRRRGTESSDSDVDLNSALAAARKRKKTAPAKPQPAIRNPFDVKSPFGGPLPFEKLDWKSSIFSKKESYANEKDSRNVEVTQQSPDGDIAGGFDRDGKEVGAEDGEEARPLPPWMMSTETDIRDALRERLEHEREVNEADREAALREERRQRTEATIEIESSDDDDSDIELLEGPPPAPLPASGVSDKAIMQPSPAATARVDRPVPIPDTMKKDILPANTTDTRMSEDSIVARAGQGSDLPAAARDSDSAEAGLEHIRAPEMSEERDVRDGQGAMSAKPSLHDAVSTLDRAATSAVITVNDDGEVLIDGNEVVSEDEFSDVEDDEILAQMTGEAEEHARFASQLNHRSEKENQEAYEKELKALRSQQKKDRRDADEVTQIMVTECQALLRLFGIPYMTAPMEAEAQCAELVRLGLADGIVTDDSDTFLFGGTRIYKNMFNSNKLVECYLSVDVEQELSLSRDQLISLAQLLGSDYTEGLPGVGPVTAVEILSEFPGKDGLIAFRDWWQEVQNKGRPREADARSIFRKKFRKSQATKLFLPAGFPNPAVYEAYVKPEVDSSPEVFQWGLPDVDGLRTFLMATIGWSQERTDEVLVPVVRDMNKRAAEGTQSNITRYMDSSLGSREGFAPRQRPQASKRMATAVNRLRAKAAAESSVDATREHDTAESTTTPATRRARAKKTTTVADDKLRSEASEDEQAEAATARKGRKAKAKAKTKGGKAKAKGAGARAKA